MRDDHRAQRALYKAVGLKELMDWQKCPLIDVRANKPSYEEISSKKIAGCLDRMVFECGIYWAHSDPFDKHGGRPHETFYMVRRASDRETKLWQVDYAEPYLVILVVFAKRGDEARVVPNIFDNATGDALMSMRYLPAFFQNKKAEDNLSQGMRQEMHAMANDMEYLAALSEHPVTVTPPTPRNLKRHNKTKKAKPWLREDLSRIIMMDPTKARSYGHRIDTTGTHASPIPHHRRGHYMTLRHERYGENRGKRVWVRPAWIGDEEWIYNGSTYRVLMGNDAPAKKEEKNVKLELAEQASR